jgi:hypothetical protein
MIPAIVEQLAQLRRMDAYRIVRPDLTYDVPGVRRWLQTHESVAWGRCEDAERVVVARRLLFLSYLCSKGRLAS